MNQNGDKPSHGGDRLYMAKHTDVPEKDILDFSVNVRPDGPLPSLMGAITRAINDIGVYPSPHAEEAMQAASDLYGLPVSSFVFGNGTTRSSAPCAFFSKSAAAPARPFRNRLSASTPQAGNSPAFPCCGSSAR